MEAGELHTWALLALEDRQQHGNSARLQISVVRIACQLWRAGVHVGVLLDLSCYIAELRQLVTLHRVNECGVPCIVASERWHGVEFQLVAWSHDRCQVSDLLVAERLQLQVVMRLAFGRLSRRNAIFV